jgi:hypothetical protein
MWRRLIGAAVVGTALVLALAVPALAGEHVQPTYPAGVWAYCNISLYDDAHDAAPLTLHTTSGGVVDEGVWATWGCQHPLTAPNGLTAHIAYMQFWAEWYIDGTTSMVGTQLSVYQYGNSCGFGYTPTIIKDSGGQQTGYAPLAHGSTCSSIGFSAAGAHTYVLRDISFGNNGSGSWLASSGAKGQMASVLFKDAAGNRDLGYTNAVGQFNGLDEYAQVQPPVGDWFAGGTPGRPGGGCDQGGLTGDTQLTNYEAGKTYSVTANWTGDVSRVEFTSSRDTGGTPQTGPSITLDPASSYGPPHTFSFSFTDSGKWSVVVTIYCADGTTHVMFAGAPQEKFDVPGRPRLQDCWGESGIGLNPASWVPALIRGTSCVLQALFVPYAAGDDIAGMRDAYGASGLNDYVTPVQTLWGTASGFSGAVADGSCSGPLVNIPHFGPGGADMAFHPLDACGASAPLASRVHDFFTFAVYIGAAYTIYTMLFGLASSVLGGNMSGTQLPYQQTFDYGKGGG